MTRELLRLEGISFGKQGQTTLDDFGMTLREGEILGVLSERSVEKNALIGVIAGRLRPQSGRLYLDDEPSPFDEADKHRHRKVGIVGPANTLVDDLSIAENIFVIRKGFGAQIIHSRLLNRQTQQLIDEFGLGERDSPAPLSARTTARKLSPIERCSVEIMKAAALGARILILHDLSSFLSDVEVARLLALASRLKARGLGFVMVDSSARHLANYADRVVLVKKGRNFWTFGHDELNEQIMKSCFAREPVEGAASVADQAVAGREEVLVFDCVCSGVLDGLRFSLHHGEELCIFDEQGDGIEEIRALLVGDRQAERGSVRIGGEPLSARNAWQALDQRVAFVVENPVETMLFRDFTALENLCYPTSRKATDFWIDPLYLESCRREYGPYFSAGALEKYPSELSARDLQALIYCRWHLFNPRVVVCVKPFSSVEKRLEEVSAFFIGLLLKKGIAVLILTSNATEADRPCRRIVLGPRKPR